MHLAHDLGLGQVEEVRVVQDVARMVAEALPAELGLRQSPPLQQDAPGAVEHQDALGGERADRGGRD